MIRRRVFLTKISTLIRVSMIGIAALTSCSDQNNNQNNYVTWSGIGPDKWASVWLIQRHIDLNANIEFIPVNTSPTSGTAFDIPDSAFQRTTSATTFRSLMNHYQVDDPVVKNIATIIRDIEIDSWRTQQSAASPLVEREFRNLQFNYGRENVPDACYLELFDRLYSYLNTANKIEVVDLHKSLTQPSSCEQAAVQKEDRPKKQFIHE